MTTTTEPETTLGALWRLRRWVIGMIIAFTAIGAALNTLVSSTPTATAVFAVADPRGNDVLRQGVTSETSFQTYAQQRAAYARSGAVLAQARDALVASGIKITAEQLHSSVTTASDTGALITVSSSGATSDQAVGIVNAVIQAYVTLTKQDLNAQAQTQLTAIQALIKEIRTQSSATTTAKGTATVDAASEQALAQLQIRAANVTLDAANTDIARFVDPARAEPIAVVSLAVRGGVIGAALAVLLSLLGAFALVDVLPAETIAG